MFSVDTKLVLETRIQWLFLSCCIRDLKFKEYFGMQSMIMMSKYKNIQRKWDQFSTDLNVTEVL